MENKLKYIWLFGLLFLLMGCIEIDYYDRCVNFCNIDGIHSDIVSSTFASCMEKTDDSVFCAENAANTGDAYCHQSCKDKLETDVPEQNKGVTMTG